jgi:hypothetical protein
MNKLGKSVNQQQSFELLQIYFKIYAKELSEKHYENC